MLKRLGALLPILVLTIPVLFGLAGTLLPAFGYLPALGGHTFTLHHLAALAARPGIARSAAVSLASGLVTAAVALAVVMLFVAGWAGTRSFARIQHLISPLLSIPHAAAAFGLAFLVAPAGMIARSMSPWLTGWERPPDVLVVHDTLGLTMMAGLILKEIPFLLLVTLAAMPQVKRAESRAVTAALGYGRIAGFLFTTWPQIYRQVRLAVFAVIAFASSVVDVATILGPNTPAPLAVRLLEWMNDPDLSMRYLASAGALLQFAVTATALGLWIGLERLGALLRDGAAGAGLRLRHDAALRNVVLLVMVLTTGLMILGLVALALWSFAGLWPFPALLPSSFTPRGWLQALPRILRPLSITLGAALLASSIAVLLAILWFAKERPGRATGRGVLFVIYLPLIIPQIAFLFGLQLFFLLTGAATSFPALVLAHLVFVLPYVFLSLAEPWRSFDRRYEAVAAGLGASRARSLLRVRLPMLLRALMTAGAVGFAVSVGLYLPTVLIGAGRLPTITTEAVALAAGGDRRVIGVYAFLQMLLPAIGFAVATLVPALLFRRFRTMRV